MFFVDKGRQRRENAKSRLTVCWFGRFCTLKERGEKFLPRFWTVNFAPKETHTVLFFTFSSNICYCVADLVPHTDLGLLFISVQQNGFYLLLSWSWRCAPYSSIIVFTFKRLECYPTEQNNSKRSDLRLDRAYGSLFTVSESATRLCAPSWSKRESGAFWSHSSFNDFSACDRMSLFSDINATRSVCRSISVAKDAGQVDMDGCLCFPFLREKDFFWSARLGFSSRIQNFSESRILNRSCGIVFPSGESLY